MWPSLTYDADKFWEITAAVVPVIALAFVLELRSLPLQRSNQGPAFLS